MFLSAEEIQRLTGKAVQSEQIAWLRANGYRVTEGPKWSAINSSMDDEIDVIEPLLQCIYAIAAGSLIKVGVAKDVDKRWRNLRIGNRAIEPVLYATKPLRNALRIEKLVHRDLARYRVGGEWFQCDRSIAIAVVKRIEQEASKP
jgi:Meiotically Up-regulated Gene 113 (MUG113) protein/uncharacterized protein DUF4224